MKPTVIAIQALLQDLLQPPISEVSSPPKRAFEDAFLLSANCVLLIYPHAHPELVCKAPLVSQVVLLQVRTQLPQGFGERSLAYAFGCFSETICLVCISFVISRMVANLRGSVACNPRPHHLDILEIVPAQPLRRSPPHKNFLFIHPLLSIEQNNR